MDAKGGKPVLGPTWPFWGLAHPDTFQTSLEPKAIVVPCTHMDNFESFKVIRSVLMVHHGLDYTCTWHLKKLCVLIAVDSDPWNPKHMYGYLKQWYNPKPLWVRLMPSYFIGNSAYLVWAQYHLKYFCNVCILGYFMSILLFPTTPHHQYGEYPSSVGIFWPYQHY